MTPHIRITAQQAQKPRAWRPWATFCSLNSLGTQQSLWLSLRAQLRGARRPAVLLHTNYPVSQRGRCVQLPKTRRAHVLPGGCWRVAEVQAVPAAMRGCGRGDAALPGASDPRGCGKQPLSSLLLHLGDCSTSGAKRQQRGSRSPLERGKGEKGGRWGRMELSVKSLRYTHWQRWGILRGLWDLEDRQTERSWVESSSSAPLCNGIPLPAACVQLPTFSQKVCSSQKGFY